jgi:hypothetical protein
LTKNLKGDLTPNSFALGNPTESSSRSTRFFKQVPGSIVNRKALIYSSTDKAMSDKAE